MTNNPQSFPELNFSVLERYAKRWIDFFSKVPIGRIVLYRFGPDQFLRKNHRKTHLQRYVIVFEINQKLLSAHETVEADELIGEHFHNHKYLFFKKATDFDELMEETNQYSTGVLDGNRYSLLMDIGFLDVYKKEPPMNLQEKDSAERLVAVTSDWLVDIERPGETCSFAIKNEPCWILWDIGTQDKKDDPDELVLKYGMVAESLYEKMVTRLKCNDKTLTTATTEDRRSSSVSEYDENPDAFFPLNRSQINAPGPYDATEKYRRKMIGMILVLARISEAGSNYQTLYNRYLSLKTSK